MPDLQELVEKRYKAFEARRKRDKFEEIKKDDYTAEQYEKVDKTSLYSMFDQIPVDLETYLYNKDYLGVEKLSDTQYAFVEYGTQIYFEETMKALNWKVVEYVDELVAKWGKGAGKDWVSAIILSRVVYLVLCLKEPLLYYGQSKFSHIDALNMAYSGEQAENNFFAYFTSMIKGSKWFRGKWKLRPGRIEFPKSIRAFSGNSYEETFEGKNLLVCVLDEIAAFKTNEELEILRRRRVRAPRYSAEAVYDMACTSVSSRFPKGIGKVISLSFTRYKGDFIEKLYGDGKKEKMCFVSEGATWEVNPLRKRSDFDSEYRKNPERAASRYECKPSGRIHSYFKRPDLIAQAFKEITAEECPTTDDRFPKLKNWFKAKHGFRCAVHIDLGWKGDSAGIAMAHCYEQKEEGEIILPLIEVSLVTSFIVPRGGEIIFDNVRDFVLELRKREFNIQIVTMDGFQSVQMMQQFQSLGIESKIRSLDRDTTGYDDLKSLIYEGRLIGYFAPRVVEMAGVEETKYILRQELLGLVDIGGRKVDHKTGGVGKDEADAVAGAIQGALELGFSSFSEDDVSLGTADRVSLTEEDRLMGDREYLSTVKEV